MAVSELPGNPNAVWTVKKNIAGTFVTGNMVRRSLSVVISSFRGVRYLHCCVLH